MQKILPKDPKKKYVSMDSVKVVILFMVLFAIIGISLRHKVLARKLNCKTGFPVLENQPAPWDRAQAAYQNGAKYLDGDGDGIACENLLPKHER